MISFLCKEWVHWRSIPSRRLWQSTKTDRWWGRWGQCSIYRHPSLSDHAQYNESTVIPTFLMIITY